MKKKTSKELLMESILELSETRTMDKITVKDIAANCGLTTQTFYNHFRDKDDLVLCIHKDFVRQKLEQIGENGYSYRDVTRDHLSFYWQHRKFLLNAILHTHGHDAYNLSFNRFAVELTAELICKWHHLEKLSDELYTYLRFYVYGAMQLFAAWAYEESPIPKPEKMDYLLNSIPAPLRPYLLPEEQG